MPVVIAAKQLHIPVIIHESDMTPGLANKLSIPSASKVCCNFPETVKLLPEGKAVLTGSPIREELFTGKCDEGLRLCGFTEEKPVLSYCSDFVTLQSVTSDGMNYTYSDDIRMRSIQSALGYTNVMLNMYDIFWPQKDTDRWEIMQKRFSSNLLTYWKEFSCFASTTLSESNTRTRTFLNLDYSEQREENKIILQTSLAGSWFILRTHGEEIADIQGGSQIKIQEDAYLICAEDTTVEIKLQERWRKK